MAFTYKRGPIHIRISETSGWLPAVAVLLCLGLFAMAALQLLGVNAEPKSFQSANVTAVSAQGFSGLRRLLEARGHEIVVNRMEDGPQLEHGALEIITLDNDGGALTVSYQRDEAASASSQMVGEGEEPPQPSVIQVPDPRRARHVLYQPLGRVVLVVAPKWQAITDRRNPRWAQGETLLTENVVRDTLGILSPVDETPIPDEDADEDASASSSASQQAAKQNPDTIVGRSGDNRITFQRVPYSVKRDALPVTAKSDGPAEAAKDEETQKALVKKVLEGATPQVKPIARTVTLKPAPDQAVFTAPLMLNRINGLQSISGPNLKPILLGPDGETILSRVIVVGRPQTQAPVYLLSDPDVLNNQILADPQKVLSALALTDGLIPHTAKPGRVIFNLTFNGISFDHDLLHALSRPPFIGVPLCLLIAGLGLMWAAFSRFGPAREAPAGAPLGRGVQILADNAARLMAITVKEVRLGPSYADLVRDRVIRDKGYRIGLNAESPDDLAERIGRMHNTTDSFTDLKARAAKVVSVHHLIGITLRLHAWKTEIQRAHN